HHTVALSLHDALPIFQVPSETATAFGVMAVDEEFNITEFAEKPAQPKSIPGKPGQSLASMGIYVFSTKVLFRELLRDQDRPDSRSEEHTSELQSRENL